jgi:5-methylthioadenosine/S-adenosylhomocysteine deaminase
MIFEADWVLPIVSPPIELGAVRVVDGRIEDVGRAEDLRGRYPDETFTNFHHAVLLPGFVNAHTHLEYSVFRGFLDNLAFPEWMLAFIGARKRLNSDDYVASAMLGAMECVGSGITTVGDTMSHGRATLEATKGFGMRACAFVEVFGMDDANIPGVLKNLDQRMERFRGMVSPLTRLGVSPHAPYTVSGPLYRALMAYSMGAGVKMATHVAESKAEVTFVRNGAGVLAHDFRELVGWDEVPWMPTGASPVKYLEQWGALNANLLAVHCVQVSQTDIEVMKENDVAVAHCPKSNAKLACGIAPVGDFLAAGLRVGIGSDSLASNNLLDMFGEMRVAILLHRASQQHTEALQAEQALRIATLGGAQVLGLDDLVGSLEPGKRADMIAVDMEYSHFAPIDDPVSALVYGANQEDVFFAMIDGEVVYSRKKFQDIDVEEITDRAMAVRAKLR